MKLKEDVKEIEYKEKDYTELENILIKCKMRCVGLLEQNDLQYRMEILEKSIEKSKQIKNVDFNYLSRLHELKSILLFSKFGKLTISNDFKHEKGPDLLFNNVYIECVTANVGNKENYTKLKNSGFEKYSSQIIDYGEKSRQMILRFTTALSAKVDQYSNVWNDEYQPYCIFLHLGRFSYQFRQGEFLDEMTKFLLGKGPLVLSYDTTSDKVVNAHYQKVDYIKNNNSSDVAVNFFDQRKNAMVSAVIVSSAYYSEDYDLENTVVFKNYNAEHELNTDYFNNFVIWTINDSGEYVPTRNGKQLKLKDIKII